MTQPLAVARIIVGRSRTGSYGVEKIAPDLARYSVPDDTLQWDHCQVTRHADGTISIRDLETIGGTYICRYGTQRWQRLQPGAVRPLQYGDVVLVGSTLIPYTGDGAHMARMVTLSTINPFART